MPWKNLAAVTLVAPLGMTSAFAATLAIGLCRGERMGLQPMATIVIETGVQNSVLAMAIVSLSYSVSLANSIVFFQLQLIVIMWGIMVSFEALCVTLVFRWYITGRKWAAFCGREASSNIEPAALDSDASSGLRQDGMEALQVDSSRAGDNSRNE